MITEVVNTERNPEAGTQKGGFDIVIVGRRAAEEMPFDQLQTDFLRLCKQLGLLEEQDA